MGQPFEGDDGDPPPEEDETSVEWLLGSMEEDTETVIERLRESGTRQYVSDTNVDDVLAELGPDRVRDSGEDGDANSDGFGLRGGPKTTVSRKGIDEVFEKLEAAAAADRTDGDDRAGRSDRSSTDLADAAEDADFEEIKREFGSLSGRGPTRTTSDRSVDEVLDVVSDDAGESDGADEPVPEGDATALRPDDPEAAMAALVDDAVLPIVDDRPGSPDDDSAGPSGSSDTNAGTNGSGSA